MHSTALAKVLSFPGDNNAYAFALRPSTQPDRQHRSRACHGHRQLFHQKIPASDWLSIALMFQKSGAVSRSCCPNLHPTWDVWVNRAEVLVLTHASGAHELPLFPAGSSRNNLMYPAKLRVAVGAFSVALLAKGMYISGCACEMATDLLLVLKLGRADRHVVCNYSRSFLSDPCHPHFLSPPLFGYSFACCLFLTASALLRLIFTFLISSCPSKHALQAEHGLLRLAGVHGNGVSMQPHRTALLFC